MNEWWGVWLVLCDVGNALAVRPVELVRKEEGEVLDDYRLAFSVLNVEF